ncbi:MAG: DEAD/DEAH box helicase [Alphaproteobacteria bacterium]|nr:MAG: DEAD/DEAH box helicase [Alphaproteobacteria bacterium]
MAFNPIAVLDQVTEEYRNYIQTEFRARDLTLRQRLSEALERPRFLAREPFFQAHRPFRNGKRWHDLPIDKKFATVMERRAAHHGSATPDHAFTHQSGAISELLADNARPVVVTTGTGSGKTEAFLLPILQNALLDARTFNGRPGLTAIIVYPMNALANDQRERIGEYLEEAGLSNAIRVEQYDRSTTQADRQRMRERPPHVLLTNYMMLEYLLVRPADREAIFANHRCRYLVLDEVHTYRGTLGTNIALLVRRVREHLRRATHEWLTEPDADRRARRFPVLVPVGTSATIKSLGETADPDEARRQRDEAVREFFGRLTGVDDPDTIQVFGEELVDRETPAEAVYPADPVTGIAIDVNDAESVRTGLCRLAGLPAESPVEEAVRRCKLIWDLHRWLIRAPLSLDQLVDRVMEDVPERRNADREAVLEEVHAALLVGTALPDGSAGLLRLRSHRFFRGGWRFHRCLDPDCRHLQPMGEERCSVCGHTTAPLLICRSCGADYVGLDGDPNDELLPAALQDTRRQPDWLLYEPDRFEGVVNADDIDEAENEENAQPNDRRRGRRQANQAVRRPQGTLEGRFNCGTLEFDDDPDAEGLHSLLSPSTKRCLCCGGTAGSHSIVTPIQMGTSAAVKVLAEGTVESLHEANAGTEGYDGKDRLLIFADSRQDAAHQARFIAFTGRYDRMRQRVHELLHQHGPLSFPRLVELLGQEGVSRRDNRWVPEDPDIRVRGETLERVRAWEEAPLLDQLAANANYRGTLVNLGLVEVQYAGLDEWIREGGDELCARLGLTPDQFQHVCRCVLDEMRTNSALTRPIMRYHPAYVGAPAALAACEWERSVKSPAGYTCDRQGLPIARLDPDEVPPGIRPRNIARVEGGRGRAPGVHRIVQSLVGRYTGHDPDGDDAVKIIDFLRRGGHVVAVDLYGFQRSYRLLQVNAEETQLALTTDETRVRCGVCMRALAGAAINAPCPRCHGSVEAWPEDEFMASRAVERVQEGTVVPLIPGEHTAQVPADLRKDLEEQFKAASDESSLNVLACSPTLEMGIDVGGLEAVAMRNIPPRPDNYAQRGGRAGRRARVGLVVSYSNRRPHDQYFYDHPDEMIAGEVPAPTFSLGNRDVLLRHACAIAFGAAEPGLAGQMVVYVSVDGQIQQSEVDALRNAVMAKVEHACDVAMSAFGALLAEADLGRAELQRHLADLDKRIQDVIARTARQVQELRQSIERFAEQLNHQQAAIRASNLIKRILGVRDQAFAQNRDADDRSAGYPLRRFAEFGILPGYQFPTEPASLRLLGDENEDDAITTHRRFGIGQYQPEAPVFARSKRWRVAGIDTSSPWNPRAEGPSWQFRICRGCGLRHRSEQPRCPRCTDDEPAPDLPAFEYGGFVATRNEAPVLQEEDRFAARDLVRVYPQWDGELTHCWSVADGWTIQLRRGETVDWINEGPPPTRAERDAGIMLHDDAVGYRPCGSCGRLLSAGQQGANRGGRRRQDPFGHAASCPQRGQPPRAVAIATSNNVETLRLVIPIPRPPEDGAEFIENAEAWGRSLGEALLAGARHAFMLAEDELEFDLEGPWTHDIDGRSVTFLSILFTDPTVGGSGYLERIAESLHIVAEHALEHLRHADCETACYRCLKTYRNQRHHKLLEWPLAEPALRALGAQAPQVVTVPATAINDPGPWLEAYAEGVGSPLELRFWRLFQQHGFSPQKQAPVGPTPGAPVISVADFAVPAARMAIYVDGASVHVGHRLRRDRIIRSRLREADPPWRIVELRAPDLGRGEALVKELIELTRGAEVGS